MPGTGDARADLVPRVGDADSDEASREIEERKGGSGENVWRDMFQQKDTETYEAVHLVFRKTLGDLAQN